MIDAEDPEKTDPVIVDGKPLMGDAFLRIYYQTGTLNLMAVAEGL